MSDTPLNRHHAEGTAAQIKADLVTGDYDPTLAKYRSAHQTAASTLPPTVELFEQFIEKKKQDGVKLTSIATSYRSMQADLTRYGSDLRSPEEALEFINILRSRQAPSSSNRNLQLLKSFGRFLVKQQHLRENIFSSIKPLKLPSTKVQNRTPFTKEEIKRLLETMRTHPACYKYHDFTVVLFSLGLRPSEAIGLRWCHIDLEKRKVTICESMSRISDGVTVSARRQRQGTKTGNIRVLPLNDRLLSLFAGRKTASSQPDDLVFTSATGKPICDRHYREFYWKPACKEAGVTYRPPYAARHTFISHGIEYKNWTPQQAAEMAGHSSTRMVSDVYGHMMDKPELPDI